MKKIAVIFCFLLVQTTTVFGLNVNDDPTLFGVEKGEYGPKPRSLTFTLLGGAYFHGFDQHFPITGTQFTDFWRYGVKLGYTINENIELDSHLAYTPTVNAGIDLNVYDYGLNGIYNFIVTPRFVPYGTLGVGGISFVEPLTFRFTRFQANYGVGLKFFIFKNMALAPEFLAISSIDPAHTAFSTTLNATYYFDLKIPKKIKIKPDSDHDGVPDDLDKCPNTPLGAKVDINGCEFDSDHDGVVDSKDKCPNTPLGIKVDANGCPLDSDGDGVPDDIDKCPDTPKDVKVDATGCPIIVANDRDHDGVPDDVDECPDQPGPASAHGCPDRDNDGIPDYRDQCPDEKETYNGYKDDDGCPDDELDEFSGVIDGINFETGRSLIKKESYPKLNRAAEVLGKYPILNFVIEGHTDSTGSKALNMKLSEKRAQSVYEYLRYRGLSPDRMSVEAFGPTKPIADNKTKEGRTKNRRIEFRILNLAEARKEAEERKKSAK